MRLFPIIMLLLVQLSFWPQPAAAEETVTVYSARKEELIRPIFDRFTRETGIAVRVLSDDLPKLMARLESEGEASPADILIGVDVANIELASQKGLLQGVSSEALDRNVPAAYRDDKNEWFGLSKRVRAVFYNRDKVKPQELSTYEDLADPKWKGRILTRSSSHPYNQSLLANVIAVHGKEGALKWAKGLAANFAREPRGGDADQIRAVAAGEADLAVANSYYYGRMLVSDLPEDKLVAEKVGIFFPNQNVQSGMLSGAHLNISGGGVAKHAKNLKGAVKLLEFLTGSEAQAMYADANKEYPVNPAFEAGEVLKAWGEFKAEATPLSALAAHSAEATRIADEAGWK